MQLLSINDALNYTRSFPPIENKNPHPVVNIQPIVNIQPVVNIPTILFNEPKLNKYGIYCNWENSCYLDSLMMVLYYSKGDILNIILNIDIDSLEYRVLDNAGILKFINPFLDSDIRTLADVKNAAKNMCMAMTNDYNRLIKGDRLQCKRVREILRECDPDMYTHAWTIYSAAEIYDTIAHLFLPLMIEYTYKVNGIVGKQKKSMFSFWEFMANDKPNIEWDNIVSNILVFRNTGLAIRHYNSPDDETISMGENFVTLHKDRIFGKVILNRYDLVGVVMLQGTQPGQDSGSHYVSYINTNDGWFYYDDAGVWENRSNIDNVFNEEHGNKPELYFYRLKST